MDPSKIPYNYKPTPTLQLMAKAAKFSGQRKADMYGAPAPIPPPQNTTDSRENEVKDQSPPSREYKPTYNFAKPPVDPAAKLLDPSYKEKVVEAAQPPVRNSTPHGNAHTSGSLGNLLDATKAAEMAPNPAEFTTGRKFIGTKYANFNIIGGQAPSDPYATTAGAFNEGKKANLDDKNSHRKKPFHEIDPKQMVSPITGELIADYGTWAADLEAAKKGAAAGPEEDEPYVEKDPLLARFKAQLDQRGAKGVIGLGRLFRIMDDDGSNSLNFAEFKKAMREFGLTLTEADQILLFKRFDRSNAGSISYNDFLRTVAGNMNGKRRRLVNMAFDVLDKDGSGLVDITDIAMAYDVSAHPDFRAGKKTKEQVLMDFLEGFDVGGEHDGVVTRDEFANYYSNLSSSIARDDYFELMIRNAWHISGGEGAAANSSNTRVLVTREDGTQFVQEITNDLGLRKGDQAGMMARLKAQGVDAAAISTYGEGEDNKKGAAAGFGARPTLAAKAKGAASTSTTNPALLPPGPGIKMLIQKIRNEMKSRGSGGFIGLQRRFRIMDDDGSKSLSMAEFKKAMKEMNMGMSEADLRLLFEYFDSDKSGSIDFEEFVQGVREPMTERRLKLVNMAFDIIDKDGSGEVDGAEVASMYDASKHPEVLSRHKTAAQVLREFLDTFDVGGVKDGKVTRQEFVNYYSNISASIDNEDYFELMIRNAWHISGGEGNAQNSSNMRVLVTDFAGNERRVLIENDLGLKQDDMNGIYNRLVKQGVKDIMAINGKMLKRVNVNGVDVITTQGTVSQIEKDVNKVNVHKAPSFARGSTAPAGAVRPLSMTAPVPGSNPNINLIGRNGLAVTSSKAQVASTMYEDMQQKAVVRSKAVAEDIVCSTLLDVLRTQLLARGPAGIIELQRKFVEMDTDNSRALDRNEFKAAMLANKLAFSDAQLVSLFSYFDSDRSGTIDYTELLSGLRGELSPKLLVLVHQVFDLMDHEGRDEISPDTLLTHFDPSRHPDVLTGARSSDAVLKEFLDTVDVGGQRVGVMTRDEFVTYYTNICAAVNDDDYSELILRKCWHLKEDFAAGMAAVRDIKTSRVASGSSLVNRMRAAQSYGQAVGGGSNNMEEVMYGRGSRDLPSPQLSSSGAGAAGGPFPPRRPSSANSSRRPSANSSSAINNIFNRVDVVSSSANNSRPQSASGSTRGILSGGNRFQRQQQQQPLTESTVLRELREIQTQAVQAYNGGDLQLAENRFIEALTVLQMVYPSNHPEVMKAEKSISMVQAKMQSGR